MKTSLETLKTSSLKHFKYLDNIGFDAFNVKTLFFTYMSSLNKTDNILVTVKFTSSASLFWG